MSGFAFCTFHGIASCSYIMKHCQGQCRAFIEGTLGGASPPPNTKGNLCVSGKVINTRQSVQMEVTSGGKPKQRHGCCLKHPDKNSRLVGSTSFVHQRCNGADQVARSIAAIFRGTCNKYANIFPKLHCIFLISHDSGACLWFVDTFWGISRLSHTVSQKVSNKNTGARSSFDGVLKQKWISGPLQKQVLFWALPKWARRTNLVANGVPQRLPLELALEKLQQL